jgi:hypothetical protein
MTKCMLGPGNDCFVDVYSFQFVMLGLNLELVPCLFKEQVWPVLRAFVRGRLGFRTTLGN